ncbi:hypothetical protein ACHAWF_018007, partial [Thalassiosira exigua]
SYSKESDGAILQKQASGAQASLRATALRLSYKCDFMGEANYLEPRATKKTFPCEKASHHPLAVVGDASTRFCWGAGRRVLKLRQQSNEYWRQ